MPDLRELLASYLEGRVSLDAISDVVDGFDWNDDCDPELRRTIARLELLLVEVDENLRAEQDVCSFARSVIETYESGVASAISTGTTAKAPVTPMFVSSVVHFSDTQLTTASS